MEGTPRVPTEQQQERPQEPEDSDEKQPERDDTPEDLEELSAELEAMDVETLQARTNEALDHFRATHSEAQQTFIAEAFIESGVIPTGEAFGVTEAQAQVVEAGFVRSIEQDVLSQHGLTFSQWETYIDAADAVTMRRAAMRADWATLHTHAQAVAAHIREHGDSNAGLY